MPPTDVAQTNAPEEPFSAIILLEPPTYTIPSAEIAQLVYTGYPIEKFQRIEAEAPLSLNAYV